VEAKSYGVDTDHEYGTGLKAKMKIENSPLGMGIETDGLESTISSAKSWTDPHNTPTQERTNGYDSGWALTLKMSKSISTSSNPGTAGRASDLILGVRSKIFLSCTSLYSTFSEPRMHFVGWIGVVLRRELSF
jgi:hypothetical protein